MKISVRATARRMWRRIQIRVNRTMPVAQKTWELESEEEINFWSHWLWTRGGAWPEEFQRRCDPDAPLQPSIAATINHPPGATVHILDVGAGPLTYLGKCWDGWTLQITAVDPLAEAYDELLKRHQLQPVVRTQKGYAERLTALFPENSFDLVHARNCIDHSYDPLLAIRQMVAVTKPGGVVYMHHAVNEAEQQNHQGFHQWNLYDRGGELFVSNQTTHVNVTQALAGVAEVCNALYDGGIWMINLIRKHPVSSGRNHAAAE